MSIYWYPIKKWFVHSTNWIRVSNQRPCGYVREIRELKGEEREVGRLLYFFVESFPRPRSINGLKNRERLLILYKSIYNITYWIFFLNFQVWTSMSFLCIKISKKKKMYLFSWLVGFIYISTSYILFLKLYKRFNILKSTFKYSKTVFTVFKNLNTSIDL